MPNIGPLELIVVLVIALLVLGPKKLPDVGRSVGKGMREFKGALSGMTSMDSDEDEAIEKKSKSESEPEPEPAAKSA